MYVGGEPLRVCGTETALTANDFRRWRFSDLTGDTVRAAFAEFLVAASLDLISAPRRAHRAFDLLWSPEQENAVRICVRSAACAQSDDPEHPDRVLFGVPTVDRCDVCAFCVFTAMSGAESPLNMDLWDFYLIRSARLNGRMSERGFVTLPALLELEPVRSGYDGIAEAIRKALRA